MPDPTVEHLKKVANFPFYFFIFHICINISKVPRFFEPTNVYIGSSLDRRRFSSRLMGDLHDYLNYLPFHLSVAFFSRLSFSQRNSFPSFH